MRSCRTVAYKGGTHLCSISLFRWLNLRTRCQGENLGLDVYSRRRACAMYRREGVVGR